MNAFDTLADVIAGKFEMREWDRMTTDQRHRAREAASAAMDALGMGVAEMTERLRAPHRPRRARQIAGTHDRRAHLA